MKRLINDSRVFTQNIEQTQTNPFSTDDLRSRPDPSCFYLRSAKTDGFPFLKSEGAVKDSVIELNYIFTVSEDVISRVLMRLSPYETGDGS